MPALLGLSSASFQISIKTQNEAFQHASCPYVPECEATSVSSDAGDQGMYCNLKLAYTPCTNPNSTRRANCQVGLLYVMSVKHTEWILLCIIMILCQCVHENSYIITVIYFLYSLCLQLSFIASCCIQGSKQKRIFTVDVGNVSAIDTLNFTFATKVTSDEIGMTEDAYKACGHIIWLGDLKNMWQETVLRCDEEKNGPSGNFFQYKYSCTPSGGKVCRNVNLTNSTSCSGE